jgi:hypothetical protein
MSIKLNSQQRIAVIIQHEKSIVEERKSLFGAMPGSVKLIGDIVESTSEIWEAETPSTSVILARPTSIKNL